MHTDGSRTPAWDPGVSATPAREEQDYNYDSSYNPATPGYSATPYTPQTPGGYASDHSSYSPYQQSPASLSAYNQPTPSPGGFLDNPSPSGSYQPTPSPGYNPSPMTYASPMTPSAGFHPQTPGTGLDHYSSTMEWHATGIEVIIKESHPEPGLRAQIGIIRNVLANTCAVFLLQEERTVNIQPDQLKPVVPKPGERVKVIA
ncbi:unnamed protein product, partial [Allacma fusca]